jgi:hypothetical protein
MPRANRPKDALGNPIEKDATYLCVEPFVSSAAGAPQAFKMHAQLRGDDFFGQRCPAQWAKAGAPDNEIALAIQRRNIPPLPEEAA